MSAAGDGALAPSRSPDMCHTAPVKSRKRSWGTLGMLSSKRASLSSLGTPELQIKQRLKRQQSILSGWLASAEKPSSQQVFTLPPCTVSTYKVSSK